MSASDVKTVLVVESDPMQRELAKTHLDAAGFHVRTAAGVAEALESAQRERPDVVLSEVLLDDLDGFALCQVFRNERDLARVPIVLTSAYFDEEEDRELAALVGARALVERSAGFEQERCALLDALDDPAPRAGNWTTVSSLLELYARRLTRQMTKLRKRAEGAEARCGERRESVAGGLWAKRGAADASALAREGRSNIDDIVASILSNGAFFVDGGEKGSGVRPSRAVNSSTPPLAVVRGRRR